VRMLPAERQSLFFSATMPKEIGQLAGELLRNPERVAVTPVATPVETIDQSVIFIDTPQKRNLLAEILGDDRLGRTLVFTRTKHGADRVVRHLESSGIASAAIHGNKSQSQRERALGSFREGRTKVLIATDIAARGIDVDGVTHVINFDLPNIPESYVHRIGRTARAGASGVAISFCDAEERAYLRDIEKLIRRQIPATDRRVPGAAPAEASEARNGQRRGNGHGNGHKGGRHNGRQEGRHADRPEGRQESRHERSDRHASHDRQAPANGTARHAEPRRDSGHHSGQHSGRDAGHQNGGTPAYSRPASAGGPSRKFRRGGAPRRMGV